MRRWLCKVRSLPSRINRCLPRATTSTTESPVRSVVTRSAIRSSALTSWCCASAVRNDRAASHTVFPSGTASSPASRYRICHRSTLRRGGCYRRSAGGSAGISLSTLGISHDSVRFGATTCCRHCHHRNRAFGLRCEEVDGEDRRDECAGGGRKHRLVGRDLGCSTYFRPGQRRGGGRHSCNRFGTQG